MPRLDSPHWNQNLGVCEKHNLPQIPCPACLCGNGDEDMEIVLTETDRLMIDFGDSVMDMIPSNLTESVRTGRILVR